VKKSAKVIEQGEHEAIIWFVAVDDKPVGPVSVRKIHKLKVNNRISDDSSVWKEGMLDWESLRNVNELVGALAKLDLEKSLGDESSSKAAPEKGLLASDKNSSNPLMGIGMGEIGHRNDTNDDNSLEEELPDDNKQKTDDDFFKNSQEFSSVESLAPSSPLGEDRSWKMMAAIGFFIVSIVVFAVVLFSGEDAPATIIKEKIVTQTEIVYRDRPIDGSNVKTTSPAASADSTNESKTKKSVRKKWSSKSKKVAVAAVPQEETAEQKKKRLLSDMLSSGPAEKSLTRGRSSSGGSGASDDTSLSQKQMQKVIGKNSKSLQLCYERALKTGGAPTDKDLKVMFNVDVGTSGMVKTVSVTGAVSKYARLKTCLKTTTQRWMFPSSGGTSKVQFPILFTPSR